MQTMMPLLNCVKNRQQQLLSPRMQMISAFTIRNPVKICCEFLHLLFCICWEMRKNTDTVELSNKAVCNLSFLSSLSRRIKN